GQRGASRKTEGPDQAGVGALLRAAAAQANPVRATRDVAIVWLLAGTGLRRSEVAGLRIEHLDLDARRPTVLVRGKCRSEREPVRIPAPTVEALRAWLAVRPAAETHALFVSTDARTGGGALGAASIYNT